MRAEAHVGEIARTAVGVANGLVQARLEPGITGPMHHAVANRNADVDPAHAEKLNPKTKIQNPKLIQTAFFKVLLVHAEIMAELVQVGDADLFAIRRLICAGEFPKVFEKKDDLSRLRMAARPVG